MLRLPQSEVLLVAALAAAAQGYLEPLLRQLPEKRLSAVGVLLVIGILAGQSRLSTHMARGVGDGSRNISDVARRLLE